MANKIRISVPKPCSENWDAMMASEKGKFCSSCQKNIIDFTTFSDREILKYYNQNSKICGRFHSSQINRNLILPKEKNSVWMMAAASIIAFLGFGNQTAKAQESVQTEQTHNKIQEKNIKETKNNKTQIITGVVTDGKFPIPGVIISIKGFKKQTETDMNGNYTIEVKKGTVLVFSFIGFESVEKKISGNTIVNITMKEEVMIMGEVIIIKYED